MEKEADLTTKILANMKSIPEKWPPRIRNAEQSPPIGIIGEVTKDGAIFELNQLGHQLVVRPRSAVTMHGSRTTRDCSYRTKIHGRVTRVGTSQATLKIEQNGVQHEWPKGYWWEMEPLDDTSPLAIGMPVHIAPTYFAELDWSQLDIPKS